MDVILIPGFWLDGSSWEPALGPLRAAGHRTLPLTLPGKESQVASRRGIGLADHVRAVVEVIDASDAPVILVGHSGGSAIAHGALDARPDAVAHIIHVDAFPLPEGRPINAELPAEADAIPLPDWSVFEEAELRDLDEATRTRFRTMAVAEPRGVAADPQRLVDERRLTVPSTIVACCFTEAELRRWMDAGDTLFAETARLTDLRVRELPTGHWPQLTRPGDLGELLAEIVGRA